MKIEVSFGYPFECVVGTKILEIEHPSSKEISLESVLKELIERFPELEKNLPVGNNLKKEVMAVIGVNSVFAEPSTILKDGDQVVILYPGIGG